MIGLMAVVSPKTEAGEYYMKFSQRELSFGYTRAMIYALLMALSVQYKLRKARVDSLMTAYLYGRLIFPAGILVT